MTYKVTIELDNEDRFENFCIWLECKLDDFLDPKSRKKFVFSEYDTELDNSNKEIIVKLEDKPKKEK